MLWIFIGDRDIFVWNNFKGSVTNMDSYSKYAQSFWDRYGYCREYLFKDVKSQDIDEVAVAFAVEASFYFCADNFRIFPLNKSNEFFKIKEAGCCGSFDSQVKCLSGRVYWIGFNYGH